MQYGEKFNTITHLLAAVIAVPGIIYLIVLASKTNDSWRITSVSIYGATLLLLYIASSIYHGHGGRFKKSMSKV